MTLVGRNEVGFNGNPGAYNWSLPESYSFQAQAGSYLYVLVWDDGGPQMWAGQFDVQGVSLFSDTAHWQYTVASGANPGETGADEKGTQLIFLDAEAPHRRRPEKLAASPFLSRQSSIRFLFSRMPEREQATSSYRHPDLPSSMRWKNPSWAITSFASQRPVRLTEGFRLAWFRQLTEIRSLPKSMSEINDKAGRRNKYDGFQVLRVFRSGLRRVRRLPTGGGPASKGERPLVADKDNFDLSVETLEATESGPVVCKATLTYRGSAPLAIAEAAGFPQHFWLDVSAPAGWERTPSRSTSLYSGPGCVSRDLSPKERVSQFVYLHQRFAAIPPGKAQLKFTWHVSVSARDPSGNPSVDENGLPIIAHQKECTADCTITVVPASSKHLGEIAKAMEGKLSDAARSLDDRSHLANMLIGSKHPSFAPIALRLMRINSPDRHYALAKQVAEWSSTDAEVRAALVHYLRESGARWDYAVFDEWEKKKPALREDELKILLRAKEPWIRAYTYKLFPKECGAEVREALLRESEEIRDYLTRE